MGNNKTVYKVFVGRLERKGPLRRHKQSWENNIKMEPKVMGWQDVDWICLNSKPVAGSCEYGN
jgi:hypothetical protein